MDPRYRLVCSSETAPCKFLRRSSPACYRQRIVACSAEPDNVFRKRRNLLLGGLGSLSWHLKKKEEAKADVTPIPIKVVEKNGNIRDLSDLLGNMDLTDPDPQPSKPTPVVTGNLGDTGPPAFPLKGISLPSLSSGEWLSIFSIGSSLGLGALAVSYKSRMDYVLEKLKAFQTKLGKTHANLHQLTAENAATVESLDSATMTVNAQKKQIQIERAEVVRLDGELDKVKIDLAASKAQGDRILQKLHEERVNNERSLGEAKGSMEALKKKLVDSEKLSQERGLELERVQCELTGKLEEIDQAAVKIGRLEYQVQSMEETLYDERERVAILEEARSSAVSDVRGLLAEQRNLTFNIQAEQAKVSELRAALQTRENEISQLRPTVRETVSQLRSTSAKLTTTEHELAQLRSSHQEAVASEESLKQQALDLSSSLEKFNTDQIASNTTIQNLQADIEEREQRIEMLESSARTMEAEMELLQAELDLRSKEVEGGRLKEERLMSDVGVLERQLMTSKECLADVEKQLSLEQDQTEVLKWDLERKKEEIMKGNHQAEELGTRLQRLEVEAHRLAGVEDQLGIVTREAEEVQTRLAAAERDNRELIVAQSKLKESEANLRALREELKVVQSTSRGELRKVKMQLSESQGDVKKLKKEVIAMEEQAAELKEKLRIAEEGNVSPFTGSNQQGIPAKNAEDVGEYDEALTKSIREALDIPERNKLSGLVANEEMEKILGTPAAARAVAGVRAEAVILLEEIENNAFRAIAEARKKAESCEKAAMDGLMKATAADERADRLQKSVDDLTHQLAEKDRTIQGLRNNISSLTNKADSAEAEVQRLKELFKRAPNGRGPPNGKGARSRKRAARV